MTTSMTWLAALSTVAILLFYEVAHAIAQLRHPERLARTAHAALREEWFAAVSQQKGSEILAVQTLRNSMMSATMTASTAVLGLMGTVTLAAPSLHAGFAEATSGAPNFTARLALFASLVSSAMALRYYNHTGFICAMPTESDARKRWANAGIVYVRRAGLLYSWGLRHLVLIAPVIASILHPAAGPIAAVIVVAVLFGFDQVGAK
jgi:hypothetical protein